jgi:hypothetical protein
MYHDVYFCAFFGIHPATSVLVSDVFPWESPVPAPVGGQFDGCPDSRMLSIDQLNA